MRAGSKFNDGALGVMVVDLAGPAWRRRQTRRRSFPRTRRARPGR